MPAFVHRLRPPTRSLPLAAAVLVTGLPAAAQDAGGNAPTSMLLPSLTAEETYLETRGRLVGENGHEAVTRLTPGFRYVSRAGRLQGTVDYAADLLYRVGRAESKGGEVQNQLNAALTADLVSNWLYVDTAALISQQSISAFGQQTAGDGAQYNANRTEVRTVSVSPYARGSLGGMANYEVRLVGNRTDSKAATAADSKNSSASFQLTSARGGAVFGWALSGARQRVEFTGQSPVDTSNLQAQISVAPAPELRLTVNGGRETSDDATLAEANKTNTSGIGMAWNPSPRTTFAADLQERFFGRAKHVTFAHRSAQSSWSYNLTRDTANGANGIALLGQATRLQLRMEQLKLAIPDLIERERQALADLTTAGINPNEVIVFGALASSYSIQLRHDLSFAWYGPRLTFNLQAYSRALSQITLVQDADPATGEAVKEHGYSAGLTYRLTPLTSVGFGGSRAMVFSTTAQPGNDLKSAYLNLSSQLGPRTFAQLGTRYTVFNSTTEPYRETSLSGSISLRF